MEFLIQNPGKFEKVVLLKSVEHEITQKLIKTCVTIGVLLKELHERGCLNSKLKYVDLFDLARERNLFSRNHNFLELYGKLARRLDDSEGFMPSFEAYIELASRMKKNLLDRLAKHRSERNFIHFGEGEHLEGALDELDIHEPDKTHIRLAHLFTMKHDDYKGHNYMFITYDRNLCRSINFEKALGKLTIMYYSRFLEVNGIDD